MKQGLPEALRLGVVFLTLLPACVLFNHPDGTGGSTDDGGTLLDWTDLSTPFADYAADIDAAIAAGTLSSPTASLSGIVGPLNGSKWSGSVLAPNGKIYCIPGTSTEVLVIDPETDTFTTFTHGLPMAGQDWNGGVLATNGKIYGFPYTRNNGGAQYGHFLEIDPETETATTVGPSLGLTQGQNYTKGVLALNGKIYMIPARMGFVIKFDPEDATAVPIGSDYGATALEKWDGAVLAPNGKIYGIPEDDANILVINPSTDTTSLISIASIPARGWIGGVLASNGKIYANPSNSDCILEIDPSNDSFVCHSVTGLMNDPYKYWGGALGADGRIYSVPAMTWGTDPLLIMDPNDPSGGTELAVNSQAASFAGNGDWDGATLAPNGKIYMVPHSNERVLIIDTHPVKRISAQTLLSPFFNKY